MRGGALPVLAWAAILAVLLAGNWVWEGDPMQLGDFGFAVLAVALWGLLLTLAARQSLRRGPPSAAEAHREGSPDISFGAVGVALGLAAAVFGLAFGHFMIYFGAGLFAFSLVRVMLERRAERTTTRMARLTEPGRAAAPGRSAEGEAPR